MTERRRLRSWVDAINDLIARIPGPPWLVYLVLIVGSTAVAMGVRVLDGSPIDALAVVFAALTFTPFAVMHYINRAAKEALEDFRPALGELEPEYATFERQLTTTSVWTGIAGAAIGIAIAAIGVFTAGGGWGVVPTNGIATNILTGLLLAVFNGSVTTFVLHEFGHLRTITRIHREATNIQLWNVRPQNAFARVSAAAAVALTLPYGTAALVSALVTRNGLFAGVLVAILVVSATLLFVGPLVGMRRRLVREKEEQLSENDRASEVVATRLRSAVDGGQFADAAALESAIGALGAERERLRKTSTWPWNADTLRAFLTSLGIPVALWLVTTLLGRLLFS